MKPQPDTTDNDNRRLMLAASDLLIACKAQHEAIDRLFALLIEATRKKVPDTPPFMPSQSGQPWEALNLGYAAIAKAEGRSLIDE